MFLKNKFFKGGVGKPRPFNKNNNTGEKNGVCFYAPSGFIGKY